MPHVNAAIARRIDVSIAPAFALAVELLLRASVSHAQVPAHAVTEHTFVSMRQLGLFSAALEPTVLIGDRGDVCHIPAFLDRYIAAVLFDELHRSTTWRADSRMMYGRRVLVPRETAARGEACVQDWSPTLLDVRAVVEARLGTPFDYVFINRYRDGNDSVAWHNDDDAAADPRRVIASLSLGATRTFEIRPLRASGLGHAKIAVALCDGDLVVMQGETQLHYEHRVPKEPRVAGERINLTFRQHRVATARPAP